MNNCIRTSFTDWEGGLQHFGTKGMKWGQRRYQNEDGSLTPLGEKRYGSGGKRSSLGRALDLNKMEDERNQASQRAQYYKSKAYNRQERQNYRAAKKGLKAPVKDAKTLKLEAKSKAYEDLAKKSKAMGDRILKNTLGKKMSVKRVDVLRTGYMGYQGGKAYSVRNNGKGQLLDKKRSTDLMQRNRQRADRYATAAIAYHYANRVRRNRRNGIGLVAGSSAGNHAVAAERILRRKLRHSRRYGWR